MSETPLLSDCGSTGSTLDLTLDGVSTHDGVTTLEEDEAKVRSKAETRSVVLLFANLYSAIFVLLRHLITLSSLLTIGLTVLVTMYWSTHIENTQKGSPNVNTILLSFALLTPLANVLRQVFDRRERALVTIAKFRSATFLLFMGHCIYDWGTSPKGREASDVDVWVEHADEVLRELVALSDELFRFLTLPISTTSRHQVTRCGRREAANTMTVADEIYNSMLTRRLITLARFNEKLFGSATAATSTYKPEFVRQRIREEWICESIENLRVIKMYRTSKVLNVLFEICAIILPPFFASSFAVYTDSKGLGGGAEIHLEYTIIFAVLFALCLHVLYQGVKTLEDPFIGVVALDGIHVHEELKVMSCRHLVNARNSVFPGSTPLNVDQFISCTKEVIISKNYILHCEKERAKREKEMANRERDEEEGAGE